jgi:phage terminase small subunit
MPYRSAQEHGESHLDMTISSNRTEDGLTQKQESFCLAFVETGNASEAYRRAYNPKKMTAKSVNEKASHILAGGKVKARIAKLRDLAVEKSGLTIEKILLNLSQTIHFDPRRLYKEDGSLKSVRELDDDTASALTGLEVVEMAGGAKIGGDDGLSHVAMYTKKLKWLDKNVARDQAMKHLGLYSKDKDPPLPPQTVKVDVKLSPSEAYLRMLRRDGKPKKKA